MSNLNDCFIETYGDWYGHGWGTMIIYYTPLECKNVVFYPEDKSQKTIVFDERLYKKFMDKPKNMVS